MTLGVLVYRDAPWEEIPDKQVDSALQAAFSHVALKKQEYSVGVLLTFDQKVQALNKKYRGKDAPTNVLAFPTGDQEQADEECLLGDLILGYHTVKKEAAEQNKSILSHTLHLLVHGFLHLIGYDHVKEPQARVMEKAEIEILKRMGVPNPYA